MAVLRLVRKSNTLIALRLVILATPEVECGDSYAAQINTIEMVRECAGSITSLRHFTIQCDYNNSRGVSIQHWVISRDNRTAVAKEEDVRIGEDIMEEAGLGAQHGEHTMHGRYCGCRELHIGA